MGAARIENRVGARLAEVVIEGQREGAPEPAWAGALRERVRATAARRERSWDLYGDLYGPTFDALRGQLGEQIALVVHFVETVDGEVLSTSDRALVAKLVRQFGKAALYGLDRAIGVTEEETGRDRYRYARQVARGGVRDARRVSGATDGAGDDERSTGRAERGREPARGNARGALTRRSERGNG